MILDFETHDLPPAWGWDVCVVGAGAAGLVLAHELLRGGLRVLLLEGGGRTRWERKSQSLNKTDLRGHAFAGAHSGRFRGLGGSTSAWAGQVMRLDPIDFERRDWAPGSGWPIARSDLDRFYARAEEVEGVANLAVDDDEAWSDLGLPKPDMGPDFKISLSRYCPEKKFARLFADAFDHPNLIVALHANAVELLPSDDRSRIQAVRVRTLGGKETVLATPQLALCLGGIESSRFLLNQTFAPWDAAGLVGRHFQDHIQCFAGNVTRADWNGHGWAYGPWRLGGAYLPKLKLSPEAQRVHRTLNVSGMVELEDGVYPALRTGVKLLAGPLSTVSPGEFMRMLPAAPVAIWHHLASKKDPKARVPWARPRLSIYCEQEPLSQSRITLSGARDALGMRRAALDWRISELELHTIRIYARLAKQAFEAHGVARIELDKDLDSDRFVDRVTDQFHHCGGTRMSGDPAQGVVDTDLRLHGLANAYVCSSSVFPTSGFTNPTQTIIALAVRLAEQLKERSVLRRAA